MTLKIKKFFIGVNVAEACNFIKKETLTQVFPVNFAKFLGTPFLTDHHSYSRFKWLLLFKYVWPFRRHQALEKCLCTKSMLWKVLQNSKNRVFILQSFRITILHGILLHLPNTDLFHGCFCTNFSKICRKAITGETKKLHLVCIG